MLKIGFIGDVVRHEEILDTLKMIAGEDCIVPDYYTAKFSDSMYYLEIDTFGKKSFKSDSVKEAFNKGVRVFEIEEFKELFPYEVGVRVFAKTLNKYATIVGISDNSIGLLQYLIQPDGSKKLIHCSTDQLTDRLYYYPIEENDLDQIKIAIPSGYEFIGVDDDKQNIILEKIKSEDFPKTLEDCCDVLEISYHTNYCIGYAEDLLDSFQQLLICRDAYWKIEGWNSKVKGERFYINSLPPYLRDLLPMPTKESSDAFYENFKDLIESCCNKLL